ncbi:YHS domain-containing (seleno)protein [Albidovulum sp.]
MSRKGILAAAALAALCSVAPALAADEVNVAPGLTYGGAPLGLHGADPVALLDGGTYAEGNAGFAAAHDGVAYYFASEENLRAFEANPARYAPQYGGFCAFGVSVGKKFDGDPRFAAVLNDKLYVFLNEDVFKAYLKDQAGTIEKAEGNWTAIEHTAATEL